MAHLRATINSKGGECSRLGNKKDGMTILVEGQAWRLNVIILHNEEPPMDNVFVARIDKDTDMIIGEVTRFDMPCSREEVK